MEDERGRGRVGERESLREREQYRLKGVIDATELFVKWTLPSQKLLLIKLTRHTCHLTRAVLTPSQACIVQCRQLT
jgi:hypothetical protein